MRDDWYGDKRDLVKWSVLLHLAQQIRAEEILQVPYYRPTQWNVVEIDGIDHPIPNAVLSHFRAITRAEQIEARCRVKVLTTPFVNRGIYSAEVQQAINFKRTGPLIVFLDPDTGLAPAKAGLEHVLESELRLFWRVMRPGDLLVFYQHQTNRNGQPWIEPKRQQFEDALGLPVGTAKTAYSPKIARDVVFFHCKKLPIQSTCERQRAGAMQ